MIVRFPTNKNKYWNTHYRYVLNILKFDRKNIIDYYDCDHFKVYFNNIPCYFDYADTNKIEGYNPKDFERVFKFHCTGEYNFSNIRSFPPISFYDWSQYYKMATTYKYKPTAKKYISNRQKAYGNATHRRKYVRDILMSRFGDKVWFRRIDQNLFFMDIESILVSVCVPGWCNNMLDRGQLQYMGLGVCTLSPYIPEYLPGVKKIDSWFHYMRVADDYSDLNDTIRYLQENPQVAVRVGNSAKNLFQSKCTPDVLNKYIRKCLDIKE